MKGAAFWFVKARSTRPFNPNELDRCLPNAPDDECDLPLLEAIIIALLLCAALGTMVVGGMYWF